MSHLVTIKINCHFCNVFNAFSKLEGLMESTLPRLGNAARKFWILGFPFYYYFFVPVFYNQGDQMSL
jgi:hypothetical protein